MAKKQEIGGTKRLDPEVQVRIAQLLEAEIKRRGISYGEAVRISGIDKSTISRSIAAGKAIEKAMAEGRDLANETFPSPSTGIHYFIKLRNFLQKPIDDLMGLPPVAASPRPKEDHHVAQDRAVRAVEAMGCPRIIIDYALKTFSMTASDAKSREIAWIGTFIRIWDKYKKTRVPPPSSEANEWRQAHPETEWMQETVGWE